MNILFNSFSIDGVASLLIACIEILLLINLLIFSEKNGENIVIYFIIALLAGYQFFEFLMCSIKFDSSFTAYLAFVDISYLPPLNLLLVLYLTGYYSKLNYIFFLPALFFTVYYFFTVEEFKVVKCTVIYATYNYPVGDTYGFFYYLPLLFSVILMIKKRNMFEKKNFLILFTAHLFIILPVITGFILLYLNLPGVIDSMESILCKFAFGYAITLSIFCFNNKTEMK